tara:strand:+ start:6798 stop:8381 length:1584 start_codon:yes stop_codon:yes gene_type:complete
MNQSLKRKIFNVSLATTLSKSFGLFRQLIIASYFGIGMIYDAFNYAYIIPGFLLIIIGGINGPIHNAIVRVLTNASESESKYIFSALNTKIICFLIFLGIFIFLNSGLLIQVFAPGLEADTRNIAIKQLQILTPLAPISGLLGISYGALNAKEELFLPSISPIFTSIIIIIFIPITNIYFEDYLYNITLLSKDYILSTTTVIGAFIQWLILIPKLKEHKLWNINIRFDFKNTRIRDALKIIIPGVLSTSIGQVNLIVDLFFASSFTAAAAGLGYATFLTQAPLGIASNALIIPLLTIFARLSYNKNEKELKDIFEKGLLYILGSMFFVSTIFIFQNEEIVNLIYKRGSFDYEAVDLVKKILIAYAFGMPFYLCRDYLVRLYYSIGNSSIPFKTSIIAIFMNIFFDWLLIGGPTPWGSRFPFNLEVIGIVVSSTIINLISCIILLSYLKTFIKKINLIKYLFILLKLIITAMISGILAYKLPIILLGDMITSNSLLTFILSSILYTVLFIIYSNLLKVKLFKDNKLFF